MSAPRPAERTLGDLRARGASRRTLRQEMRENLLRRMRTGEALFPGILGYDETVIPAVENALLCGHDLIFLGERGQAKSRMIRALVDFLDPWMPVVAGSEIHDDPFAPVSAHARRVIAERADETEIDWVPREDRYVEKLATPDVSIADLIGDVDPVKVAEGRSLADELTIHFGLLPRTHRGIFCINELPDLTEKVQVGLFNVMQERDVQVKGYRVRLPLDVLVVASANPEDYTSRGRIITPLKDRYAAQIRTHYPPTRDLELAVVRQEARLPRAPGVEIFVPPFLEQIIGEVTLQARASPDVNQTSGVSVRMSISNYETLVANAVRRAVRLGEPEAVPRIVDLEALVTSTAGKLELEYAGEERSEVDVVRDLMRRATRVVFEATVPLEGVASVVESFQQGWNVEVSAAMPAVDYLEGLDEIRGLREAAAHLAGGDTPARLASAIEFVLEGLHLCNRLNKSASPVGSRYGAT
jgi:magnesium chelatase subunit I